MNEEEIIAYLALNNIHGLGSIRVKSLIDHLGTAKRVFEEKNNLAQIVPGITPKLSKALNSSEAFIKAEKEIEFIKKGKIECFSLQDKKYPQRLKECIDAPSILFFKGNAELNTTYIINVIGTRHITEYGKEICQQFIRQLKELCPKILIVSGLAYGVDICAHREALKTGASTVAVLAHGLDRIYPYMHRKTAIEMLTNGGLLTEYTSETRPDKYNFVQRNRIVAGLCDATILIESASKGGALITAQIADSYHRECFAFPGRVTDEFSKGCNRLIQENKATLIQSAEDFLKAMNWDLTLSGTKIPKQPTLFQQLTKEEETILHYLQHDGDQQINSLVVKTNLPIHKLHITLFELEMKGIVKAMAGGVYHLV